jgi:hypothetical protein
MATKEQKLGPVKADERRKYLAGLNSDVECDCPRAQTARFVWDLLPAVQEPAMGRAKGQDVSSFPAGLPLTREAFEAWFDTVYEIALRGAFYAKATPACSVGIGRRGRNDVITSDPSATRREVKHDTLSIAVELVYTAASPRNPILGKKYECVEHLAHSLRKLADGHAHRRLRVERKAERLAPSPIRSGVKEKTANAVPETAEDSPSPVRFIPKYVAYEKVSCPACHRADVPLTTRRCPDCSVLVPHGARVQLRDEARERLWARALVAVESQSAATRMTPGSASLSSCSRLVTSSES